MVHDQSIIQALSIFHLQEKTKEAKTHYYSYLENGLNMKWKVHNRSSFLLVFN